MQVKFSVRGNVETESGVVAGRAGASRGIRPRLILGYGTSCESRLIRPSVVADRLPSLVGKANTGCKTRCPSPRILGRFAPLRTPRSPGTLLMVKRTGKKNMEILIPIGVLVGWFALQAWILPRFGVPT